jgi:hypothetical protein
MPVARMRLSRTPLSLTGMMLSVFIIGADDRIGVDIFGLADELAQNELTPIALRRAAARGVPGGGSLDPIDRIENAVPLDNAG